MGKCIICGTPVDGHICSSHEEDALFTFEGNSPEQLTPGRYYEGTVDGYAEFGVFVDIGDHVTGLLHRSELDRRLESLDWEAGDTVFVQVTDVRDNGNVDLGWSIRQRHREFRGHLIDTPQGEELPPEETSDEGADAGGSPSEHGSRTATQETDAPSDAGATTEADDDVGAADDTETAASDDETAEPAVETAATDDETAEPAVETAEPEDETAEPAVETADTDDETAESAVETADTDDETAESAVETADTDDEMFEYGGDDAADETEIDAERTEPAERAESAESTVSDADASTAQRESTETAPEPDGADAASEDRELTRTTLDTVDDKVGQIVRIEGEVVSIRQTSGPTVFEVRDEGDVIEAAAFESAGVRAYPDVDVEDAVRIDGEVEQHHDDLQIETEVLEVLEGDDADAVRTRLEDALAAEADPGEVSLLAEQPAVEALESNIREVATTIRQAVFTGRPVVVRHTATADGYAAGAALERAVLPLVRDEHAREDAEYHFFERRPLDDSHYGMDAATDDVTDMLQDRDRHGEQFPLLVLADAGSTLESAEGYEFLDVYGVERVAIDTTFPDEEVLDQLAGVVNPHVDGGGNSLTSTALAANVATFVNDDFRADLEHLPAVSYWEDTPEAYVELAREAGYDGTDLTELRQAMALEAFYQSYKDKRELVDDLLFGRREGLSGHVSDQFREKLSKEKETARRNMTTQTREGVTFAVIDTDAFTHRFDFPPEALLLDALHRELRDEHDEPVVTIGMGNDNMLLRSEDDLDARRVAQQAEAAVPDAGIEVVGGREGHLEYLAGERDGVLNAVVSAIAQPSQPA